jgi:transcriptional regulator with XRE-family HTH domain
MASDVSAKEFLVTVGASLRRAREAKGVTLQDAAVRLGMKTRATVGHWEKGVNPIGLDNLYWLARYYETTVQALVSELELPSLNDAIATLQRIQAEQTHPRTDRDGLGIPAFTGPRTAMPKKAGAPELPAAKAPRAGKQSSDIQPKRGAGAGRSK